MIFHQYWYESGGKDSWAKSFTVFKFMKQPLQNSTGLSEVASEEIKIS